MVLSPQIAQEFVDTPDGYWLLWCDTRARDDAVFGEANGLTLVDPEDPVTIEVGDDLSIRAGEPRVAFWKQVDALSGRILRYQGVEALFRPVSRNDQKAVATLYRVFKWAPVMRLARESNPEAFQALARQVEDIPTARMATPRILFETPGRRFAVVLHDRHVRPIANGGGAILGAARRGRPGAGGTQHESEGRGRARPRRPPDLARPAAASL